MFNTKPSVMVTVKSDCIVPGMSLSSASPPWRQTDVNIDAESGGEGGVGKRGREREMTVVIFYDARM